MSSDTFDLVAHTKTAARDALNSLKEPDDDILPVMLAYGHRGLAITGAPMAADEEGKDRIADAITARIAVHQATEAALVVPAYLSLLNPATGEKTDREEMVVLIHCSAAGQNAWSAKITRHDNRPPDMSVWEPLGDGVMMGRFSDALTQGLAYAKTSLASPEMNEILEEGHSKGKVEELIAMFIAAKDALNMTTEDQNARSTGNA